MLFVEFVFVLLVEFVVEFVVDEVVFDGDVRLFLSSWVMVLVLLLVVVILLLVPFVEFDDEVVPFVEVFV